MIAGAIIATCFGIPLTVFAGALLFDRFESFVAAQLADEPRGYGADGDFPAIPSELKVSHCGTDTRKGQRNHVGR
jgi:hypothetical protein